MEKDLLKVLRDGVRTRILVSCMISSPTQVTCSCFIGSPMKLGNLLRVLHSTVMLNSGCEL